MPQAGVRLVFDVRVSGWTIWWFSGGPVRLNGKFCATIYLKQFTIAIEISMLVQAAAEARGKHFLTRRCRQRIDERSRISTSSPQDFPSTAASVSIAIQKRSYASAVVSSELVVFW